MMCILTAEYLDSSFLNFCEAVVLNIIKGSDGILTSVASVKQKHFFGFNLISFTKYLF